MRASEIYRQLSESEIQSVKREIRLTWITSIVILFCILIMLIMIINIRTELALISSENSFKLTATIFATDSPLPPTPTAITVTSSPEIIASPTYTLPEGMCQAVISTDNAPLRQSPDFDSPEQKTLFTNTPITILHTDASGDWYEVRTATVQGWIYRVYVQFEKQECKNTLKVN